MRFDKSDLHLPCWYKLYLSYLQRATTKKVISELTGCGSYFVSRYGDPTAALIKYPIQALSPLPPAIYPVHLLIHWTSDTSIIPMPCSHTLFIHHSISKCTTTCGSVLRSSPTIRPCSSSAMFLTLKLLLSSRLNSLSPSLPSRLTLLSQFVSTTTRLFLSCPSGHRCFYFCCH